MTRGGARLDADHGQVGIGIVAHELPAEPLAAGEGGVDASGAVDDVAVGEDEAVRREGEPRALTGHFAPRPAPPLDALPHLDADDGPADGLRRANDGPRIGVEDLLLLLSLQGHALRTPPGSRAAVPRGPSYIWHPWTWRVP